MAQIARRSTSRACAAGSSKPDITSSGDQLSSISNNAGSRTIPILTASAMPATRNLLGRLCRKTGSISTRSGGWKVPMKLFFPQKFTAPFRPMPASICPIKVVGTRMCPTPRLINEAATVTTSRQTPPPNPISSPRRFRPCKRASLQTDSTSSIDFVSSRAFNTSIETVFVLFSAARIAAPYIRSTAGVVTSNALRSSIASCSTVLSSPRRESQKRTLYWLRASQSIGSDAQSDGSGRATRSVVTGVTLPSSSLSLSASAASSEVDRMASPSRRPLGRDGLRPATRQCHPRGIHHPLLPHRLGQIAADRPRVSGAHRVQERGTLGEEDVLEALQIPPVAERGGRRPLEVPAVEHELAARGEHAASDLLFLGETAADHRPQCSTAEAQQDRNRRGAAVTFGAWLLERADLGHFADEVAREVDEMRALLVQLPAGEGGISPPGNTVCPAHPVRGKAEHYFALQQASHAPDRGSIPVHVPDRGDRAGVPTGHQRRQALRRRQSDRLLQEERHARLGGQQLHRTARERRRADESGIQLAPADVRHVSHDLAARMVARESRRPHDVDVARHADAMAELGRAAGVLQSHPAAPEDRDAQRVWWLVNGHIRPVWRDRSRALATWAPPDRAPGPPRSAPGRATRLPRATLVHERPIGRAKALSAQVARWRRLPRQSAKPAPEPPRRGRPRGCS